MYDKCDNSIIEKRARKKWTNYMTRNCALAWFLQLKFHSQVFICLCKFQFFNFKTCCCAMICLSHIWMNLQNVWICNRAMSIGGPVQSLTRDPVFNNKFTHWDVRQFLEWRKNWNNVTHLTRMSAANKTEKAALCDKFVGGHLFFSSEWKLDIDVSSSRRERSFRIELVCLQPAHLNSLKFVIDILRVCIETL